MGKTLQHRLSAALFGYWAGNSIMVGFLAAFLREMGYSAAANGRIASLIAAGTLVLQPLLGYLGDRRIPPRRLLTLCLGAGIPMALWLPFAPAGWVLSAGVIVLCLLCEPQATLFDNLILRARRAAPELDYGRVRAWGPLGSAAAALTAGTLGGFFPLSAMYGLVALAFGGCLLLLRRCDTEDAPPAEHSARKGAVRQLFHNPAYLLFVGCCGLFQFAMRIATTFLGLVVADQGGGSPELGILLGVVYAGQLPFMLWAGSRLREGASCTGIFQLSMLLGAARLLLLGSSLPFWVMAATQLLQAAQTGLFTRVFVQHITDITPPDLHATASGLGAALSLGMGQIVGGAVHGAIIEASGPAASARLSAGVMLGTYVLFRLLSPRLRPAKPAAENS